MLFCRRLILQDLNDVVFDKLFTLEWEQSTVVGLCGIICATLQDYFKDIEEWLPSEFYCRLTLETANHVVKEYCMALRKRSVGSFQFANELSAARHMMTDADTIRQFYKGYLACLADAGMEISDAAENEANPEEAALDELLEPIAQLARVVSVLLNPSCRR